MCPSGLDHCIMTAHPEAQRGVPRPPCSQWPGEGAVLAGGALRPPWMPSLRLGQGTASISGLLPGGQDSDGASVDVESEGLQVHGSHVLQRMPKGHCHSQVQSRATTCGDNWVCGPVLGWCQVGFPKQVGEDDRRRGQTQKRAEDRPPGNPNIYEEEFPALGQ